MRNLCLVILTIASSAAMAGTKPKPAPKTLPAIEVAQQRVVAILRDPDSAKFGTTFVSSSAVCGIVNAKNSMGGYSGMRRFIASPDRIMIESADGSTSFDYRWLELCEEVPESSMPKLPGQLPP